MEVLRKAFSQPLHPAISDFVKCTQDDVAIIGADIQGSIAHATMLGAAGLLTSAQADNITSGLAELAKAFDEGELQLLAQYEDVHMNVEKQLQARIGTDALRLHTARSRNDQVALDMRLFVTTQVQAVVGAIKSLQTQLLDLAEANIDVVMPGYTHLQRAQPISLAHALLAFVEMLGRDVSRFADCARRTEVCPLGAGALSGTSLPIDPHHSARLLGFGAAFGNSIDAVSDRDFIAEFLSAASICAIHLSQLAETFILWATSEFGFISFGDDTTTTSSLMPQKKNPDPLEIVRAKCGGITGDLVNVLMVLKSLPLGYNRDLQETKPPVIHASSTLLSALNVCRLVVASTSVNHDKLLSAASDPMMFATDIVEYLVRKVVPFREAHDVVSELVAWCRENHTDMATLSLAQFRKFNACFEEDVLAVFDAHASAAAKVSPGGTAPSCVAGAIREARKSMS